MLPWTYLLAGVLWSLSYLRLGDPGAAAQVFPSFAFIGAVGIVVGLRRGQVPTFPWLAIAGGLGLFGVGDVLYAAEFGGSALPSTADALYIAGYPLLFAGAIALVRRGAKVGATSLLDALIVGIAAAVVLWEVALEPAVPAGGLSFAQQLVALAYPVADVVLVAILLPLVWSRATRSVSGLLLVVGMALVAASDTVYGPQALRGTFVAGGPVDVGWLAGYLLVGAAGLHPSARLLGRAAPVLSRSGVVARIIAVSLSVLIPPAALLLDQGDPGARDGSILVAASFALALLVVVRLYRTVTELAQADVRFRRFMDHPGIVALMKDEQGRYTYLNERAIEVNGLVGKSWYGRTDDELYPPALAALYTSTDERVRREGVTVVTTEREHGRTWHAEKFALPAGSGSVGLVAIDITDRVEADDVVRRRESLLERAEATTHIGSWEHDLASGLSTWSHELLRIAGLEPGSDVGAATLGKLLHPDDRERVEQAVQSSTQTGATVELDCRMIRDDGVRDVHLAVSVDVDASGSRRVVGVVHDVTDSRRAELELARLGAAIATTTDAVLVLNNDLSIVYINDAFERLTGFGREELLGRTPGEGRPGRDGAGLAEVLREVVVDRRTWRGDIVDRRKDGAVTTSETTISPIDGHDGAALGFVVIKRDVTRDREQERVSERQARERALIAETLEALPAHGTPETTAAAVCGRLVKLPDAVIATLISFDDDGVATVLGQAAANDGELPGLRLPAARSAYLLERAAAGPWVERWVHDAGHPYADLLLRLSVSAHAFAPLIVEGRPVGLLIVGSDASDAVTRLAGWLPAVVEFAAITSALLAAPIADRLAAGKADGHIRQIIEDGAFTPVFQPIVELRSGAILGYEALTRFDDGAPPDVRFQEAADVGRGLELEAACLRRAFAASVALPAGAWLNVNVSPQFVMAGCLDDVLPGGGREIMVEITEHEAIDDYVAFRGAVARLRRPVRICIDDAGAGFASLRHIVELAPSFVKLDRWLVTGIDADRARQAMVAGMVHFADTAALRLIAEGIETEAELATLSALRVPLGQGYLLGRPASITPAHSRHRAAEPANRSYELVVAESV